MVFEDFHVHSNFSDGKNSPEEIVSAAVAMGMTRLGISDHGYAAYDADCCIPKERLEEHRRTVDALKEAYAGQIELFCGVEQDFFSDAPTDGYDYVIGSVHYLYLDGGYCAVDDTPEKLLEATERFFNGDAYAVAEEYFRTVAQVAERTGCDLIGHFDLISKFNEKQPLFDPAHPRYTAAWQAAADALLKTGKPFEINTGAISRGWRTEAYPAREILAYLRDRGARFVLSSDSHSADTLCFDFPRQERAAADLGLRLEHFTPPER